MLDDNEDKILRALAKPLAHSEVSRSEMVIVFAFFALSGLGMGLVLEWIFSSH